VPSGVFVASDGLEVQIVCVTERHWRGLCVALDRPEWLEDPLCAENSARLANRGAVRARLAEVIATDTAASWVERISSRGAICEHVRDIADAWSDERLVARGLVADTVSGPGWAAALPMISLARGARDGGRPAPELGADTEDVRRALHDEPLG
jgi:crotonobetainyl-CoA:carnitine CoA-transferase CaiB-like acyl-CoA transferase